MFKLTCLCLSINESFRPRLWPRFVFAKKFDIIWAISFPFIIKSSVYGVVKNVLNALWFWDQSLMTVLDSTLLHNQTDEILYLAYLSTIKLSFHSLRLILLCFSYSFTRRDFNLVTDYFIWIHIPKLRNLKLQFTKVQRTKGAIILPLNK